MSETAGYIALRHAGGGEYSETSIQGQKNDSCRCHGQTDFRHTNSDLNYQNNCVRFSGCHRAVTK